MLKALADYHLWFWHASFGNAGLLNDLNILNLFAFLESWLTALLSSWKSPQMLFHFSVLANPFSDYLHWWMGFTHHISALPRG
jgi:hypothetical protein